MSAPQPNLHLSLPTNIKSIKNVVDMDMGNNDNVIGSKRTPLSPIQTTITEEKVEVVPLAEEEDAEEEGEDTTYGLLRSPLSMTRNSQTIRNTPSQSVEMESTIALPSSAPPSPMRATVVSNLLQHNAARLSTPRSGGRSGSVTPRSPQSGSSNGRPPLAPKQYGHSTPSSPTHAPRPLFAKESPYISQHPSFADLGMGPVREAIGGLQSQIDRSTSRVSDAFSNHSSRRASLKSSLSCSLVLYNVDILFKVFDCLDVVLLFALSRVCRSWHGMLAHESTIKTSPQQSSAQSIFPARKVKRQSLVHRIFSSLSCSAPVSPEGEPRSLNTHRKESSDDSALVAPSKAKNSKRSHYFIHRAAVQLENLPTSKIQQEKLLSYLKHARHFGLAARAERRVDRPFIEGFIETYSHSATPLLSFSLCGCANESDYNFSTRPLLTSSFLSAYSINHSKNKPINVNDSDFVRLFRNSTHLFSELQSLCLAHCHQLSNTSLLFLDNLPRLTSLIINYCNALTDDTVEFLVRHNNSLTHLDLSQNRSLTNATPYYISSFLCNSLQLLNLSGNGLINDSGVEHLSSLSHLHSLFLNGLEFLTDRGVVHLAKCSSLRSLDLGKCQYVTDMSILQLALHLSLEWVNLESCSYLSDRAVHYLSSSRHRNREQTDVLPGRIGTSNAANAVISLEDDDETLVDNSWMIHSRYQSRTSSPITTPRSLQPQPLSTMSTFSSGNWSSKVVASSYFLPSVARSSSSLLHLSLARCSALTDQAVKQLCYHTPNLLSLDLSHCSSCTDASTHLLGRQMCKLNNLMLRHCIRLTDSSVVSLCQLSLQHLDLSGCIQLTESAFSINALEGGHIKLSRSLASLKLDDCVLLTDRSVRSIVSSMQALNALSISRCPLLSDNACMHLSVFAPQLRQLAVAGHEELTDAGYATVLKMPHLALLDLSRSKKLSSQLLLRLAPITESTKKTTNTAPKNSRLFGSGSSLCANNTNAINVEGNEHWSTELRLLVLRSCVRISEDTIQEIRKRGVKIIA